MTKYHKPCVLHFNYSNPSKACWVRLRNKRVTATCGGSGRLLIEAAIRKLGWVVEVLIRHGADVHYRDENGITPYEHASRMGCNRCMRALMRAMAKQRPMPRSLYDQWGGYGS